MRAIETRNEKPLVNLIMVTHAGLAQALLANARKLTGPLPTSCSSFEISLDADPERSGRQLSDLIDKQGGEVLILTDLFGATPSNIATTAAKNRPCRIVAGVNLPMLLRILNYHDLPLAQLVQIAMDGGQGGIMTT